MKININNPLVSHNINIKKPRKKRIFLWVVLSISVILIAVRIALPYVILKKINEKLEILPDYKCVVKDFSMHFLDLSITLKGVEMTKRNGKIKTQQATVRT